MRQEIENLEQSIGDAEEIETLTDIQTKINLLYERITPTNEREFFPQVAELEEILQEKIQLI